MPGKLYVIGTPIGNLEDITLRQLRLLQEADCIAAEDTRVTRKLFSHYQIHTPLLSYHEHSEAWVAENIVRRILEGETFGVVTDAGMPCISDPGEGLVRLCLEKGIAVEVVPGPCAAIAALAISGQHSARFCFEGFLSVNQNQRRQHLKELCHEKRTMIFYEAPHKLLRTLGDLQNTFGGEREVSIARELTKIHEEVWRTTLSEARDFYAQHTPKGEFALIVAGETAKRRPCAQMEEATQMARELAAGGMKISEACRETARATGVDRRKLYGVMTRGDERNKV